MSYPFSKSWPLKENTFWKNIIVQQTLMCPCKKSFKKISKASDSSFCVKINVNMDAV